MQTEKEKYFLHPGYIFVSKEPHIVSTVLGSCVAVCIWDTSLGFGGMNHHVHAVPFKKSCQSSQYGSIAIPYMIKLMLKMGGIKSNFRAHIVGGAQNPAMGSVLIGKENILIAKEILKDNAIQIVTVDTAGEVGRKVDFDTQNGKIKISKVNKLRENDWYDD